MQPDRDLVIIGAGAAGLSAAQYAAEANLNAVVIEEMAAGGQALVISELRNYPGFPEPVTGIDFSMRMEKQTRSFGTEFLNTSVLAVKQENPYFVVETPKGPIRTAAVIFATGAKSRTMGIPGEAEFTGKGVSYCATCDGPFFKNKRIVVAGGGDSACDEAAYLSSLSEKITLVHRRDILRARPALAQAVRENPRIQLQLNTRIVEIQGDRKVQAVLLENVKSGEIIRRDADAVFVFAGADPRSELADGVEKDPAGRIITNQNMETSIPGLFAAGEVRNTPFKQLVVAAGEGAVAAWSAARYVARQKGAGYEG